MQPSPALLFTFALFVGGMAHAEPYRITAAEWAQPRSGQALTQHPAVGSAVRAMLEASGKRLLIRYPGGDEGSLWARELESWLIALGVDAERVELLPGAERTDALELEVAP